MPFTPAVARETTRLWTTSWNCTRHASLNDTAIERFASELDLTAVAAFDPPNTHTFPELTFASPWHEAGFICLTHALDFGSGFRALLHAHRNGQGAWLTIRAGLIHLAQYLSDTAGTESSKLARISVDSVKSLFDIEHDSLELLAIQIHSVIVELGTVLSMRLKMDSLAEFVRSVVGPGPSQSPDLCEAALPPCARLADALVRHFPITFRDEYAMETCNRYAPDLSSGASIRVAFFKKAQLTVSEMFLAARQRHNSCAHSEVPHADVVFLHNELGKDWDQLTAFVDNVVVACLRFRGIIVCSNALTNAIESGTCIAIGSPEEVSLRACGLAAVDRLTAWCNFRGASAEPPAVKITVPQMCNYLWGCYGKKSGVRSFKRHSVPETLFY